MNVLIVYDSFFGNTEKIAKAMASSVGGMAVKVNEVSALQMREAKTILVGSPTRAFSPTPALKTWLSNIDVNDVKGKPVAAFDTRMDAQLLDSHVYSFFEKILSHAAEKIEKQLKKKGANIMLASEGFIVLESEGPLQDGEIDRASDWIKGILK